MAEPNGGIIYTTKEMLERLDKKIDRIESKLDKKVDVDRFETLRAKVDQAAERAVVLSLETRLNLLENQVRLQDKVNEAVQKNTEETQKRAATNFTRREKAIGVVLALIALVIQVYVVVQAG